MTLAEYFKPWRQKFGVLTLLLACVFAVSWIRSFRSEDYVEVFAGKYSIQSKHYFSLWSGVSANGSLYIGKIWGQPEDPSDITAVESYYRYPRWQQSPDMDFPSESDLRYLWRCCGCGVYQRSPDDPRNGGLRVVIPYWLVVIPLTILSSWLLLSQLCQLVAIQMRGS